jgi:hypothetical protein
MTYDSLDKIFLTALFVLPGYVITSIVNAFNPQGRLNESKYFLKCLLYSLVNLGAWCWAYSIVLNSTVLKSSFQWLLLVTVTLVGALLLGLFIGVIKQKTPLSKLLNFCGLSTIHPTTLAWDYLFSKQESYYVIVKMDDNKIVRGWFSDKSFASSDPDNHDLYIEQCYGEGWSEDPQSRGIYIPGDQIKYIELKEGETDNGEESKKTIDPK